jgi:D-psicose/D-tagatose/L-ribulose 3-epimerase
MRYGMNLLLWTDTLNDSVLPVVNEIKEVGYDAVEVPFFECDLQKSALWGKRFDEIGLARTGVTVRGVDDNPMSPDPAVRRRGVDSMKLALDCAAAAGCETLVGPYHSALGYFSGSGPTADEWKWAVDSMRQVAEHAEQCKVTLALECVNRFECYLMNTAAAGARFCCEVGHPRCKMMYDTFHAHIEEKSIPKAIRALKDHLVHVHISENDRSTPGEGNVRWNKNFDTLHEIGYNNLLVIEAFGLALEKLAAATKIWRRMFESERQLIVDGLKFMKREVGKRWKK